MATAFANLSIEDNGCAYDEEDEKSTSSVWIEYEKSQSTEIAKYGFEIGCVCGSLLFIIFTVVYASDFVLLYAGFLLVTTASACGIAGIARTIRGCHIATAVIAVVAFLDFAAVLAFSVTSYFLTNVVMATYHSQIWKHTNKFGFVFLGILFLLWIGVCVALLVKHALLSINDKDNKEGDNSELIEDSAV